MTVEHIFVAGSRGILDKIGTGLSVAMTTAAVNFAQVIRYIEAAKSVKLCVASAQVRSSGVTEKRMSTDLLAFIQSFSSHGSFDHLPVSRKSLLRPSSSCYLS